MDKMSPQQQQDSLRGRGQPENRTRLKYQSYRRQSAPSLVFTKALTRSKTLSRESFLVPVCPETCPLVQSFLAGSDRSFLLHGHAQLKTGTQTQERHLFLFTDVLVTAKAKSANIYKQKAQVRVCEIWTAGCMDEVCEGSTNPERSFVIGWPVCNYVATFSSEEQRETWLSLLKSRIKEEKEKEEPKTIPLRVYGKGINSFAITKTLPVSNSDSTNEVVRLALQQFSVIGHVKDYQLWVVSKRDNVPYPLIGHEFPFSVQMSHVRHTFQGDSSKDNAAQPPNKQVAMQLEQLQMCKQCQFILRPRPIETLHLPTDLSQKQFRRKRSLMTWAFWRGSSPQLNQLSRDAPRGCLFSQPLNSVCVEGTLPKPVMDMLLFLYSEGSWTRGIFRRPAGARAVRELRDSLDSGECQLPLTKDHIYVIAGVFKDFLRSIPGSLLSCELHEEWLDLLDEKEEVEGQVQDIKRMICRLPKENSLLLRYLLAMLYGIQGNAKENQMTSFNLSVCIAPSMLWPPSAPCSPEVEGEGTKKVCELVKFMIENCQQILEEDPSSLLGGLPQRLSIDEMESDTWLYPPIDSSYDSLDNELDNSSGGSPGSSSRHYRRTKPLQGSLDSILTFSEYDQDTDPDMHPTQTDSPHGMNLHTLDSAIGRRQDPDVYSPSQDAPTVNNSSGVNSLSQDDQHRRRRRSEPAVSFRFACVSGSAEGLIGDEDGEEEHSKKLSSYSHSINENKQRGDESQFNILDVRSAAMEASSSSLSSTSTPPPPIRSSLDSPDSLHSLSADQPWVMRQGRFQIKTHFPSITSSASISSAPFTNSSALTYGEPRWYQDQESCPKGSPPKETPSWGTLKGCRGLHPNSWLKKGRRLSLTQQDNLEKDGDDGMSQSKGATSEKSLTLGKLLQKGKASGGGGKSISDSQSTPISSCRTSKDAGRGGHVRGMSGQESQHHRLDSSSLLSSQRSTGSLQFPKSSCHSSVSLLTVRPLCDSHVNTEGGTSNLRCAAGSGMNELKHPSASLFYKQSGPSLSLFKENKSHFMEEQYHARLNQRRGSEPARQVMEQASALTRARLPSDPGLKVTEVDSQERATEARFCLSTGATNTVKNYFSKPCSNPQSNQEVARALAESHREWLRRSSDPTAEPDLDQLLFAEESYV